MERAQSLELPADPAANPVDAAVPLGADLTLLARGAGTRVAPELLAAYAAAAAPNSMRAFRSEVLSFDAWCRGRGEDTVPARPETIEAFLKDRGGQGAARRSAARAQRRGPRSRHWGSAFPIGATSLCSHWPTTPGRTRAQ